MRKLAATVLLTVFAVTAMAQTSKYKTFIYTSPTLSDEIVSQYDGLQRGERSLGEELGLAALGAAKGIASGYVSSAFDLGVKTVAGLVTRKQRMQEEWKTMVDAENTFETRIASVSEMSDFYTSTSTDGALDPKGMTFDGIGCLRMEGADTVFYISCHIDRSRIDRIVRHSKFQLVLDTLILSPYHSNLPNSRFDTAFSFADRGNYVLNVQMDLSSSWMDQLPQMHKDQQLGSFSMNIPVGQGSLDSTGFLRYVRKRDEPVKYHVMGESFIVPRSYTGIRDKESKRMIYGTGEYNLSVTLKETCSLTDDYAKRWKKNYRQRKKAAREGTSLLQSTWQTITSQEWDELSQQWIITVLQAPTDILKENTLEEMGLQADEKN